MRFGVLTGGGDVPGLNNCIKAIVDKACAGGHEVIGIRRGWAGLLEYDPASTIGRERFFEELTPSGCAPSTDSEAPICTVREPTRLESARPRGRVSSRLLRAIRRTISRHTR